MHCTPQLDLKINAQKLELERTLISEGYATLMREGTDLVTAVMRSSPLFSAHDGTSNKDAALAAERINVQQASLLGLFCLFVLLVLRSTQLIHCLVCVLCVQCQVFGAMSKHPYPGKS